jgi:hypothetical protein
MSFALTASLLVVLAAGLIYWLYAFVGAPLLSHAERKVCADSAAGASR